MHSFLILVTTATLGAFVAIIALAPRNDIAMRNMGVALAVGLLAMAAALLGQQAIVVLAIAAVSALTVATMMRRLPQFKAVGGVLAVIAVMLAFFWATSPTASLRLSGGNIGWPRWMNASNVTGQNFPRPP